jgi:hypothetical protein
MDSINKNQPVDNLHDVKGRQAVERIKSVVDKTQTCFFCTAVANGPSHGTRPMNVRQVDEQGTCVFERR